MVVTAARSPFFFHVGNLSTGRHFAVFADHTPARERGETEKPNETHHGGAPSEQQLAIAVPRRVSSLTRRVPLSSIGTRSAAFNS
jgi:hypothetical protein